MAWASDRTNAQTIVPLIGRSLRLGLGLVALLVVFSELGFRRLEATNRSMALSLEMQTTLHEIRALIDHGPFLPEDAVRAGLIDDVAYEDELDAWRERTAWRLVALLAEFAWPDPSARRPDRDVVGERRADAA